MVAQLEPDLEDGLSKAWLDFRNWIGFPERMFCALSFQFSWPI